MFDKNRIALNRIAAPSLSLARFYDLAIESGIRKVELRNDLGGRDAIDGMNVEDARRLARQKGIEIVSINALQKFNLASNKTRAVEELDALAGLAAAIDCPAIVLCPNNDVMDSRSTDQRFSETVDALKTFGPLLKKHGVLAYVEPLGFAISSLSSLIATALAIKSSGFAEYRIVYDTFHHHIGPDTEHTIRVAYDVSMTGLVHASGVEDSIPTAEYRDEHRVLAGVKDNMKSKEQIRVLDSLGYTGDISFEPFSSAVQKMPVKQLGDALKKSIDYLAS